MRKQKIDRSTIGLMKGKNKTFFIYGLTSRLQSSLKVVRSKSRKQRECNGCRQPNGFTGPMLEDKVWDSIAPKRRGFLLCFECIEERLGRELTLDDLNHASINYAHHKMTKRLLESLP